MTRATAPTAHPFPYFFHNRNNKQTVKRFLIAISNTKTIHHWPISHSLPSSLWHIWWILSALHHFAWVGLFELVSNCKHCSKYQLTLSIVFCGEIVWIRYNVILKFLRNDRLCYHNCEKDVMHLRAPSCRCHFCQGCMSHSFSTLKMAKYCFHLLSKLQTGNQRFWHKLDTRVSKLDNLLPTTMRKIIFIIRPVILSNLSFGVTLSS